jgi:L-asparagine oxygenase
MGATGQSRSFRIFENISRKGCKDLSTFMDRKTMMGIAESDIGSLADVAFVLAEHESRETRQQCARTASGLEGRVLDTPYVMTEVEVAGCALPARLLRALAQFRHEGNPYGAMLVRGLPVDPDIGPTPSDGNAADWSDVPIASIAQLAVTSRLGDVVAFADEKEGRLLQDVIPVPGAQDRQENSGTTFMELHTEDGFHPYKPDFLTLLCLRPDHERRARTVTGSARQVLPRLSDECVRTLREPVFRIRFASSFTAGGTDRYSAPLAALHGPEQDPDLVADCHAMEGLTPQAVRALVELGRVLPEVVVGDVLDTGDLLVVDNRVAVHGRNGFTARFDGRDRWLRRCFAAVDLRRSRGCRRAGSRICAPLSVIKGERSEDGSTVTGVGV